jgi:3,2-trans-enoyl-CoA isomerase
MASVSVAMEPNGVAVMTLAKEPVNSMDLAFWQELFAKFEDLEKDEAVRAVVFRSGLKRNVFTAGLDLKELFAPKTSRERQLEFWRALTKTAVRVYASPLVTVAAIRGACPAGGCLLSLCCDYRIIDKDGVMGLNEVALGIPVPTFWAELMVSVVGKREGELMLQKGLLYRSADLLRVSMVDEVLESGDEVLPAAVAEAQRWLQNPDSGRIETKLVLRSDLATRWAAGTDKEAESVWDSTSKPSTIASLQKVIERLSGGGKKAPAAKL